MVSGAHAAPDTAPSPRIWLNHFKLGSLADAPDSDWPVTREGLDTAFFAINTVWPMDRPIFRSIPPETAAATAAKLHRNGIRIGVECGYFDHATILINPADPASDVLPSRETPQLGPGVGELTARVEIAKLRPLWQAGHPPDFIVLDDPMRRLTVPGEDSLGQIIPGMADYPSAAREVVAYMKVMREKFPAVRFVVILNFPNWGWKGAPAFLVGAGRRGPMNWGDAHLAMENLLTEVHGAGLSIHALQGDFPWRYFAEQPADALAATVDWPGRLLALEQYARDKGLRFHLTTNSETGYVSARSFAEDSLKYLDAYLAAGGRPDHFVVQSWYPHPEDLLPEATPHTGTWLAARFIERLHEIRAGSPVKPVPKQTRPFDRSEPEALASLLQRLSPHRSNELLPGIMDDWLDRSEDPSVEVAARHLKNLREAVATAATGKPRLSILVNDQECRVAKGTEPLPLPVDRPETCIIEVVSAATKSTSVTVWQKDAKSVPMPALWVPSGGFRLLAADLDAAKAPDGCLVLCVGVPSGAFFEVPVRFTASKALK